MIDYRDLIGVPFKVHGRNVQEGFDCYGLAIEVLRRNGIELKDAFYSDIETETEIQFRNRMFQDNEYEKLEKKQELCIILFNIYGEPTHIGVYLGDNQFIHCSRKGVLIENLARWNSRIVGYYKVKNQLIQESIL